MPLDNKFKAAFDYLLDPGSNHHTGDKMICYLTYDTGDSLEVKRKLPHWSSLARGYGFTYEILSMATVTNAFFKNNPRRKKWLIPGCEEGMESIAAFFKNDLGSMIVENRVIENDILKVQSEIINERNPLLIITDLEAIHPFTRFGPIEQNVYVELTIPLIVLYPGVISGSSLEFLGFYPQDGNYRSKHF